MHNIFMYYCIAVRFKLFECELPEDGDRPKHVGAR